MMAQKNKPISNKQEDHTELHEKGKNVLTKWCMYRMRKGACPTNEELGYLIKLIKAVKNIANKYSLNTRDVLIDVVGEDAMPLIDKMNMWSHIELALLESSGKKYDLVSLDKEIIEVSQSKLDNIKG
jgi:hypothetical protein